MNPFNWSWPARILSVIGLLFVAAVLYPIFGRSRGMMVTGDQVVKAV